LILEGEFAQWMMFAIGAGNVGLCLIFTFITSFTTTAGTVWHVAAMF
jgi:hypothetical protein